MRNARAQTISNTQKSRSHSDSCAPSRGFLMLLLKKMASLILSCMVIVGKTEKKSPTHIVGVNLSVQQTDSKHTSLFVKLSVTNL